MSYLVVLESPTKVKTLSRYLSGDYLILSSNGHITKLTKTGEYNLGIDLKTFQPKFILDPEKNSVLLQLRKHISKAKTIYLATDPDREGEAISFHLNEYIQKHLKKNTKVQRVVFNEITKNAVLNGFAKPTNLDQNLVQSQITRRLLDRMMGFRLTQLLRKKINAKSAGRVQSMALKLIVKREQEILNFRPKKTWQVFAIFANDVQAQLLKQKVTNADSTADKWKNVTITNENDLLKIKEKLSKTFVVDKVTSRTRLSPAPKPLKTSTLLQLASSNFNFSVKKTMFLAQKLYEGVEIEGKSLGLITYPRTDSERVSDTFFQKVSLFIEEKYGSQFQGKLIFSKKKEKDQFKIQDAHESIHITGEFIDLNLAKRFLSPDLYKVYSLIYHYSIVSLMSPAQFKNTKFELLNNGYLFELVCEQLIFPGYLQFLSPEHLSEFNDNVPSWKVKQIVEAQKNISKEKVTKPKSRFTEGALIKNLEKIGVGRPSTYNTIVDKLISSFYIDKRENKLLPTRIGNLVHQKLDSFFPDLINEKYTCDLEEKLDKIAAGEFQRVEFLNKFWLFLQEKVKVAENTMEKDEGVKLDRSCPECSHNLVEKQGRYGPFVSCSNYPDCNYIERKEKVAAKTGRSCPDCGKDLVERKGRYGPFISCSGYPDCKYIERKNKFSGVKIGRLCSKCNKDLVERKGRYGPFISCSGYPDCKYIEKSQMPSVKTGRSCPDCGKDLVERKGRYGPFISCSGYSKCRYIEQKKEK